jgi:hypothetical protein
MNSLRALRLCVTTLLLLTTTAVAGELRIINAPHYRIHTDLNQRLAEDLAVRMEAMYEQYSHRLAEFNPKQAGKFEVYLFSKRKDYAEFTEDRFPNTGGVFIHKRNLLAGFLEGQGRDGLRRTLQHEAFHQFAASTIGANMPVWLNEGIAQIFEEGIWVGKTFRLGQVPPRRMRQLEQDLRQRRFMIFKEFLALSDKQWRSDLADTTTSAARYSQAWAMTHFLIFAPDDNGQPRYRTRLIQLLKLLDSGLSADEAFTRAFSDNYDGFQQRFLEYVRTLAPTPEAVYLEYQSVLADMLVVLHAKGQEYDDADSFRKYLTEGNLRLRYSKGDVQWSTNTDPAVYFRDSQGRSLTRQQFYFSLRGGAPLPDMICRPMEGLTFRTIFHDEPGKVDYETLIEAK